MARKTSPTQRTLKELRDQGCVAEVVERWITIPGHPGGGKRKDLFDVIDIIACRPLQGSIIEGLEFELLAVQATSAVNHTTRLKKAKESEGLRAYLKTGNKFEVWSWGKKKIKGQRQLWHCRAETVTLADLDKVEPVKPEQIDIPFSSVASIEKPKRKRRVKTLVITETAQPSLI
jgi:hypothetical protein